MKANRCSICPRLTTPDKYNYQQKVCQSSSLYIRGVHAFLNPYLTPSFYETDSTAALTQQAEYDPNTATMMTVPAMDAFHPQQSTRNNNNHGNGGRDSRQAQQHRKKGGPRASFSAAGPVHDRSQTKVVIESIPEENFEEEQVRGFFSQFGNIVNVTMMPYKRLAIVEYENWGSANKAYRSPKVIFDNRFVKVFWYKEEKHGDFVNEKPGANGTSSIANISSFGAAEEQMGDLGVEDLEEFTRRQEEAQKNHEEKVRKKEQIEKQRAELEKRQKELQAKQEAEKRRLLAKLGGSQKASSEDGTGPLSADEKGDDAPKSSTQTEALRATLAKLQEEAKAFGLDPNAPPDEDAMISTYSSFGRGGRGGFSRGRGYSSRGAYRGRGGRGNIHAAYAAFSLDNRPKKISVSGVDFSMPEKDEALRQHLFVSPHSVLDEYCSDYLKLIHFSRALANLRPRSKSHPAKPISALMTARLPKSSTTASRTDLSLA